MDRLREQAAEGHMSRTSVGVAFVGGKAYITTDTRAFMKSQYSRRNVIAHLALFRAMSEIFGAEIPDAELVVSVTDEPWILKSGSNESSPPLPVVRYCKSRSFSDILAPNIHFFTQSYADDILAKVDKVNREWPWDARNASLYGRFSPYDRLVNPLAPEQRRQGFGGVDLCTNSSEGLPHLRSCPVRSHFIQDWAPGAVGQGAPLDVDLRNFRPMLHHAHYKWLLNLDGVACTARLEQLLGLGGMVVKEESGFYGFYYPLLQPHVHYKPFWRQGPEEVLDVLSWAARHDAEAAAIGARAQAFAQTYLHTRALVCYWFTIIKELSALLRYRPGPAAGLRAYPHWTPVDEFMEEEGDRTIKQAKFELRFWD
ncbi:hypothetical protein HYH03_016378 [Edaphochlamys debaryana]|uniref:Glycosyl transferase CAP10 domain-containing protein n=1 Tax=Edaphochlamys debaryana TaxID=47281 RepID=A0A835XLC5_9CHLO|nr:hypothetical protein HYH03_016378 [Edaphochlamys debaryana]|eukprot:KAG2484898.1 hypothetical protein HYH03_016378 [Edaphochlamys debaryana]